MLYRDFYIHCLKGGLTLQGGYLCLKSFKISSWPWDQESATLFYDRCLWKTCICKPKSMDPRNGNISLIKVILIWDSYSEGSSRKFCFCGYQCPSLLSKTPRAWKVWMVLRRQKDHLCFEPILTVAERTILWACDPQPGVHSQFKQLLLAFPWSTGVLLRQHGFPQWDCQRERVGLQCICTSWSHYRKEEEKRR